MLNFHIPGLVLASTLAALLGAGCASTDTSGGGAPTSATPTDKAGTPAGGDDVAADPEPAPAADPAAEPGCAGLDAQACQATEGCQTVRGSHLVALPAQGAAPAHCLQPRTAVGCIEAQMCAEAITYFCNDQGDVIEVTNACGPVGWKSCEAPQQLQGACAE